MFSDSELEEAHERERTRFRTGEYKKLPWDLPHLYPYHYAHYSISSEGMIAYTESIEKLVRDKQVAIKPGRYLKKFYDCYSDDDITKMVSEFMVNASGYSEDMILKFVEACPEDASDELISKLRNKWEKVYAGQVQSCMRRTPFVRAYVYPGNHIGLAYLEQEGDILARSVVTFDKKTYVRVYAVQEYTKQVFEMKLESLGFNKCGHLLNYLIAGDLGYVPYIDHCDTEYGLMRKNGDAFKIINAGATDYLANNADGSYENDRDYCDNCEEYVEEGNIERVFDGDAHWCSSCREELIEAHGRNGWSFFYRDDVIQCLDDDLYYLYDEDFLSSMHIEQCCHHETYFFTTNLIVIEDCYYHRDLCEELDFPHGENADHYALEIDTVVTYSGATIHQDDALLWEGDYYHPEELLGDEDLLKTMISEGFEVADVSVDKYYLKIVEAIKALYISPGQLKMELSS